MDDLMIDRLSLALDGTLERLAGAVHLATAAYQSIDWDTVESRVHWAADEGRAAARLSRVLARVRRRADRAVRSAYRYGRAERLL